MTNAALSAARGRTTPRVEAMLLSRRARARAHLSNPAAFTDLGKAADLLAAADEAPGEDPEWVLVRPQRTPRHVRLHSLASMSWSKPRPWRS